LLFLVEVVRVLLLADDERFPLLLVAELRRRWPLDFELAVAVVSWTRAIRSSGMSDARDLASSTTPFALRDRYSLRAST
jgi:hypothetical protein